jgi:hypothetical protein
MKYPGSQSGPGLGLSEDLEKMLGTSGPAGGNHRDGHRRSHRIDQFNIKAGVGAAVLIDTVEQDLPGTELFTDPGQGDGIQLSSFSTTLDGALVRAISVPFPNSDR